MAVSATIHGTKRYEASRNAHNRGRHGARPRCCRASKSHQRASRDFRGDSHGNAHRWCVEAKLPKLQRSHDCAETRNLGASKLVQPDTPDTRV